MKAITILMMIDKIKKMLKDESLESHDLNSALYDLKAAFEGANLQEDEDDWQDEIKKQYGKRTAETRKFIEYVYDKYDELFTLTDAWYENLHKSIDFGEV